MRRLMLIMTNHYLIWVIPSFYLSIYSYPTCDEFFDNNHVKINKFIVNLLF